MKNKKKTSIKSKVYSNKLSLVGIISPIIIFAATYLTSLIGPWGIMFFLMILLWISPVFSILLGLIGLRKENKALAILSVLVGIGILYVINVVLRVELH